MARWFFNLNHLANPNPKISMVRFQKNVYDRVHFTIVEMFWRKNTGRMINTAYTYFVSGENQASVTRQGISGYSASVVLVGVE